MTRLSSRAGRISGVLLLLMLTAVAPAAQTGGVPELLLEQGRRSFDAAQFDAAIQTFNQLISTLTAGGQIQKPDILVQAYELRGRAKFSSQDTKGAEDDFALLLQQRPGHKLSGGNPRLQSAFEGVRRTTVGQLQATLTPPGEVDIDGKPYNVQADATAIDLLVGDHTITVNRPSFRPLSQKFTITPGGVTPLPMTLERVSSTLQIVTVPDGVEVLFDGNSKGVTKKGDGSSDASAPLVIGDLPNGSHRLQLRRGCYTEIDRPLTIDKPGDLTLPELRLSRAEARVKIQGVGSEVSVLFVDGTNRGQVPPELTVCEGSHLIEVRSPKGRFAERRDWKAGEQSTLTVELRRAFPIVTARSTTAISVEQLRATVERVLAPAKQVLVYVPADSDLQAALQGESVPADWLAPDPVGASAPRVPRVIKRDLGKRLASKLQVQGVAALTPGSDAYTVVLSLLAAGSSEPDILTFSTADEASQRAALDRFAQPVPPLVKPSIETSLIDIEGVQGATVVRAGGAGAKAGLALGDVVTSAGGGPVTSVADLRAKISALKAPNLALPLDVKGPTGTARKLSATASLVADALPLLDSSMLSNRVLLELDELTTTAPTPLEKAAARLSLAIIQMRLGNLDDALASLQNTQLPDGPGVSGGTIAYLSGVCLEKLGRAADAKAAYTRAAAATEARVSAEGPLVAPLAQQRLRELK